jgi:hypothetical protein
MVKLPVNAPALILDKDAVAVAVLPADELFLIYPVGDPAADTTSIARGFDLS